MRNAWRTLKVRAGIENLAAINVPETANEETSLGIHRAVNKSFVAVFRIIAIIGSGLALAGAFASWLEGPTYFRPHWLRWLGTHVQEDISVLPQMV